MVDDLKLHEEKGFMRRLAMPLAEHGNLFANSARPVPRAKQILKSTSWRDMSKEFEQLHEKGNLYDKRLFLFRFVLCEHR